MLRGRPARTPRGEAHASRAARDSEAMVTTFRRRSRRPRAVSLKKSLDQWRGVERALRWLRKQPRQVRQRARAPLPVGRFSTGRSPHEPRGTRFRSHGHDVSKPQPPTRRGVVEEEPRSTAWGGARPTLAATTTTLSLTTRTCSVGDRPVLVRYLSGSPWFVRLSYCPYTATVRALSDDQVGGGKRVTQKLLEDAHVSKWRHK